MPTVRTKLARTLDGARGDTAESGAAESGAAESGATALGSVEAGAMGAAGGLVIPSNMVRAKG